MAQWVERTRLDQEKCLCMVSLGVIREGCGSGTVQCGVQRRSSDIDSAERQLELRTLRDVAMCNVTISDSTILL